MDLTKTNLLAFMKATNDPESPFYVPRYEHFGHISFKGLKHDLNVYQGYYLPAVCRNPLLVKNTNINETDTFVITYPKSGICLYFPSPID